MNKRIGVDGEMKVISQEEAVKMVKDNDTIITAAFGMHGFPEEFAMTLEKSFIETGKPVGITYFNAAASGDFGQSGVAHLAHEGLLKRIITGHFGSGGPALQNLIVKNKIEAYNMPQGVLANIPRYIAARKPALITKAGLGTFIDPRNEGGKVNDKTTEDLIELININDEEYMMYKLPKIDVAVIRGTYADENGNVSTEDEAMHTDPLAVATAAKSCGGIVIAEVRSIVKAATLHPKKVKVPGLMVDYVVLAKPENHRQNATTIFNPALSGDMKIPLNSIPKMPLNERKIIARRASMELIQNAVVNVGVGIPDGVPTVANEEGVSGDIYMGTEAGVIGGIAGQGAFDFGSAYNSEAIIEHSQQFDFYDGGGIDVTFLGLGESDYSGNVNVSKLGGKPVGVGGFVNITQNAKKVVFCGTFTAGGLNEEIKDGKLLILSEGKNKKFKKNIEQISFSAAVSTKNNQPVLYVTERAVFELINGKLTLTEIAPGIDVQKDIIDQMEFTPEISEKLKIMDNDIFYEKWGGLRDIIYRNK
ncbi:acyl CoA:acetate/3-ketoacid CoA transferase [Youngiibacter multivorans]|uniref:Propionate CoA-transferase n=1 Tax=Youngiibacter multivorans TaxID=937251 RepID=A0ABS4G6S9_9CLOT|nr:CoA-transferase [Youngiibacter multivorans]MBP1920277.1 propionate CoA-transferase [Youngiibacter multivorans]